MTPNRFQKSMAKMKSTTAEEEGGSNKVNKVGINENRGEPINRKEDEGGKKRKRDETKDVTKNNMRT